jgi:hypothetical protein
LSAVGVSPTTGRRIALYNRGRTPAAMSKSLERVLVVDDESQVAAMLNETVSYLGYDVS